MHQQEKQNTWLKAAVIGSIWASFEIVFGSFFHSLRLPFAGTFLTFFSLVLLIAFSYKWQGRDLYFKAGVIAALMRSMMPTSVILGPLIGILTEAIMFQLAINIFGRNFFAYSLAGILAMFSAIIHKIVSIILIYGFDIVKILKNLYFVFLKTTHIQLQFKQLFIVVAITYILLGILAALFGMKIGKSITKLQAQTGTKSQNLEIKQSIFELPDFHYHSKYILLHLLVLILILAGLEFYKLPVVFAVSTIYLAFLFKRYGKALRRLAKAVFWIQLVIIVLMAIWLWDNKTGGLLVGLKMILRAVMVVSVFTAISVELKNPLVKSLLYKKGYAQLYATLGLATSAVPFILKNLSVQKKDFINPFKILRKAIGLSDDLLGEFTRQTDQKRKIYIISGNTRSGKTTFLKQLINEYQKKYPDKIVGGIIAHGIDHNNERFGFEIENLQTGEKKLLSSREPKSSGLQTGRFYFYNDGINFGRQALEQAIEQSDLLVIDEIGYLELKGKGWFPQVEQAMQARKQDMIWVVRKRILDDILQQWNHIHFYIIDIEKHPNFQEILKNL